MVQIGKKTWLPGRGSFSLYLYSKKACEHSRSHIFCLIIMKFGQNIGYVDTSDEFENSREHLKNMAIITEDYYVDDWLGMKCNKRIFAI